MVQSHWKNTVTIRMKDAQNKLGTSYFRKFEKWPILNHLMETKAIAQLCALSYMIPPKGRISHWKPSMIECEESLVVHVKTVGDISEAFRKKQIDTMYQMDLTVQSYIYIYI